MANVQVNSHFIPNGRGGRYLVFNNYKFSIKSNKNDCIHWRCVKTCGATVNTKWDMLTSSNNLHNHDADSSQIVVDVIMAELKASVQGTSKPISTMYQEELAKKCFDIYAHCTWYFANDVCKAYEKVRRNCPVSCGICAKDGVGEILKAVKWEFLMYTSDILSAGTYGNVIVTIYGWSKDVGVGEITNTDPITYGTIMRGQIKKRNFLTHFSVPQKISVEYTSTTHSWHLNKIELKNIDSGKLYMFTYNKWFKSPQTITLLPA